MRGLIEKSAESLLDFIYPQNLYCVICGNFIDSTRVYSLCDHCIRHIEWGNIEIDSYGLAGVLENSRRPDTVDAALGRLASESTDSSCPDSVRGCFRYGLYGKRLIFELKYNDRSYVARVLGKIAADRICGDLAAAEVLNCDLVCGVPLSPSKLKKRGFNQAEKIAEYFCRETGMEHEPDLLRRVKDTEALRSLSARERAEQLKGAFALNKSKAKLPRDKRILLIDDIYTTGATLRGCTEVLKEAGAKEVHALVLASASRLTEGAFDYSSYYSAGGSTGG